MRLAILTKNNVKPKTPSINNKPHAGVQGFTLIEILIVIVIISIVSSIAMLTIHFNYNKQLETFTQNLARLITLSEEEALVRSTTIGLAFTSHTFQFYEYNENTHTWQNLTHKIFQPHPILANTQLQLILNNKTMPADGKPHLIISSNGDTSAFVIEAGKPAEKPLYSIIGNEAGEIHVK